MPVAYGNFAKFSLERIAKIYETTVWTSCCSLKWRFIHIEIIEELLIFQNLQDTAFSEWHNCVSNVALHTTCSCFGKLNLCRQREKLPWNHCDCLHNKENEHFKKTTYKHCIKRYYVIYCALIKPIFIQNHKGLHPWIVYSPWLIWLPLIITAEKIQHSERDKVRRNIDPEQDTENPETPFTLWVDFVMLV